MTSTTDQAAIDRLRAEKQAELAAARDKLEQQQQAYRDAVANRPMVEYQARRREGEVRKAGMNAGRNWARTKAKLSQLRQVRRLLVGTREGYSEVCRSLGISLPASFGTKVRGALIGDAELEAMACAALNGAQYEFEQLQKLDSSLGRRN